MIHTVKGFSIVNEAEVDVFLLNEIKRCFLLGRKAMTNLESILKSKDITLPTKVHIVKETTDAFKLEKTLENPLNCKKIKPVNPKGNQS